MEVIEYKVASLAVDPDHHQMHKHVVISLGKSGRQQPDKTYLAICCIKYT